MASLKGISAKDEVREIFELRRKTEEGYISEKTVAVQKALAEGRAEGKSEEKIEIARNLLSMGLSIEQIAQGTGLTFEEIKELRVD